MLSQRGKAAVTGVTGGCAEAKFSLQLAFFGTFI